MLRSKPPVTPSIDQYGTFPAPTRGLNLRDSKLKMDKRDALVMDNVFPEETYVRLRRGAAASVTGFPGPVESLMEWSGPSSSKLFAASVAGIYDASTPGVVGAPDVTDLSNARWQHVGFANAGANFLVACNGADPVQNYNGSAWSEPAITGVDPTTLINVAIHKRRLWFVERESTNAWYLDVDAIAGAAVKFDVGAVFGRGGKLMMIGSLSQDAGDGIDDYLAFYSSNGEIAIYQGTDPADADTWAIVGTFQVGAPIGNRALLKVGGDLGLIGADGVVSTKGMLVLDRSSSNQASISNRIDPALAKAFRLYGANSGWQAITYADGHMALVNVPVSSSQSWQYVMNTQTQAWCRFKGWNAQCFGLHQGQIYFGTADSVARADVGLADFGVAIEADLQPAYQNFGSGSLLKSFKMARPLFRSNSLPTLAIRINTDFSDERPVAADAVPVSNSGPLWGAVVWGAFTWAAQTTQKAWFAVIGTGFAASPRLYVQTATATLELDAIDVIYEKAHGVAV
jgi:hypothetical protein